MTTELLTRSEVESTPDVRYLHALGGLAFDALTQAEQGQESIFCQVYAQELDNYAIEIREQGVNDLEGPTAYAEMCAREESWYNRTCNAVLDAAMRHDGPVRLLLDIDQTISDGLPGVRLVRPAFRAAVTDLRAMLGDRFQIGLLSSVVDMIEEEDEAGEIHRTLLYPESIAKMYTKDLPEDILDPNLKISTRLFENEHPWVQELEEAPEEDVLAAIKPMLDEIAVQAIADKELRASDCRDGDGKWEIVKTLLEDNPDTFYVYADNLPGTALLGNTEMDRFTALWMGLEMQNYWLPKIPRGRLGDHLRKRLDARMLAMASGAVQ